MADNPGLVVVANPFTARGQRLWARRCLADYARNPPNRTNLDGHGLSGTSRSPRSFDRLVSAGEYGSTV